MRRAPQSTPAAQLDEWFTAEYGTRLSAAGFTAARHRVWIRSDKQPIREGFSIVALKGYSYVPSWFVSLDFVPHVTETDEVRWHRTEKSALADLRVSSFDPPARAYFRVLEVTGFGDPRVVRWRIRQSARLSVRLARGWFSRFSDVASLLPEFDRAARRSGARSRWSGAKSPGVDTHSQHRLALAFTLARLGDRERAEREFDRWCEAREQLRPAAETRLRDLLRAEWDST